MGGGVHTLLHSDRKARVVVLRANLPMRENGINHVEENQLRFEHRFTLVRRPQMSGAQSTQNSR